MQEPGFSFLMDGFLSVVALLHVFFSGCQFCFFLLKYQHFYLSGDFFLAELIEAQDQKNKCVVADVS